MPVPCGVSTSRRWTCCASTPRPGGSAILSVSAVPLHPETGDPLAVLGMRDVTKVRSQRRELENFAGVVAHDLKSPLTGVISWAEILEEQLRRRASR